MKRIDKLVGQARRRMLLQRVLDASRVMLIGGGFAAAAAIAVGKFIELPYDQTTWALGSIAIAAGVALVAAVAWAWVRRPSEIDAAVQIDQRLRTRERLSSAVAVSAAERSAMGDAVIADAEAAAQRLDIRDAFAVQLKPNWLQLLVPIAAVTALMLTPPLNRDQEGPEKIAALETTVEQVKNGTQPLLEQIRVQREAAESEAPEDVDFLRQLESDLDSLRSEPLPQKKLLTELKKIEERLQERKSELGTAEDLKNQLAKLDKLDDGPAERLAEAMQEGDLSEASEELQQLAEKLERGELSKEETEKLTEQLEQMEKALEEAAADHEARKEQLRQQMEESLKAGDSQAAAKMAEQLQSLASQDAAVDAMKQMASDLGKAADGLRNGDSKAAQQSMSQLQDAIKQMQKNQKQSEQLSELAESLRQSRRQSSCSQCNGGGCMACNGTGTQTRITKNSRGEGQGAGEREEQAGDTGNFESQVRGDVGPGETAFGGRIAGPNRKTQSQSEVVAAIQAAEIESADPIETVDLPNRQRDVAREYFDLLREPGDSASSNR